MGAQEEQGYTKIPCTQGSHRDAAQLISARVCLEVPVPLLTPDPSLSRSREPPSSSDSSPLSHLGAPLLHLLQQALPGPWNFCVVGQRNIHNVGRGVQDAPTPAHLAPGGHGETPHRCTERTAAGAAPRAPPCFEPHGHPRKEAPSHSPFHGWGTEAQRG